MKVTLHLSIEHSAHFGSPTHWVKKLETPFCPRQGDQIMLFDRDPEELNDGPMGRVQYPYWNTDGTVGIDLEGWVVDPAPNMEAYVSGRFVSGSSLQSWYTERDGDLASYLPT